MELRPIVSAMRRNKFGALLIAAQMAVTLAFLANALTLIEQRLALSARPTGIDEADIFVMSTEAVDHPKHLAAHQAADLAALRSLGGVVDAYATNNYPLEGGGSVQTVDLTANQQTPNSIAAFYFGDEHALHTLDLKLIAGRNFTADDVAERTANNIPPPSGFIVTQALAARLFPGGDALGKSLYVELPTPSPIIGIVERFQSPFTSATGQLSAAAENSLLVPYRMIAESSAYMVRAAPGHLDAVMKSAAAKLLELDGERILRSKSMRQLRADAYRGNHGLVVLLGSICIALLAVTALGIVGLTSYWVAQRRRQIGIRRALGATQSAIVRYFQTENFLIGSAGALMGIALAIVLNLWMVSRFEMVRLHNSHAIGGALVILLLGQLAVLWPALRAASIAPALATRGE
ncbi:MAG TPA: FtsX-like permease family protein [Steroidobacteraceae bacterium]|jgi:putative ABC transport system permease protein